MDFSVSSLLAGLLFGAAGIWLIKDGRREGNLPWAVIGVVLLVYPYFVPNPWATWGIGVALLALAYRLRLR